MDNPVYFVEKLKLIKINHRQQQFPAKRKLLTLDEYHEEGIRETKKALEDLKQFCNTPESKPWKTMTKLNDPQRYKMYSFDSRINFISRIYTIYFNLI